ncbi:cytidine deaminase [Anabrus simplex]|uniref:cytidine deaminase n=1 Tax=Anabrus simplex TaxID=316456 RepID=UPI0035A27879
MAGREGDSEIVDVSSLEPKIQELIKTSVEARKLAYCPYSKFQVGAALLSDENEPVMYTGCNVENVAYGMTICAERTAIVKAVSDGKQKFKAIAVAADNSVQDKFTSPCGTCRQFIIEFGSDVDVYLTKPGSSNVLVTTIESLLPLSFRSTFGH